jgi:hypothetical protein
MQLEFTGEIIEWRGPAPFFFIAVPQAEADAVRAVARSITYGWGVVPVTVTIGASTWTTSLIPKAGGYLVPLRDAIRRAEMLTVGGRVSVVLNLGA